MGSSPGEGDIFDRLGERRIVFVRDPLDAAEANRIIAEFLHLESRDPAAEITLRITCAHADLRAALAVYDTMQTIRPPVATLCGGAATGGAALLLAAGAIGRRTALPSAQVVLEQPKGKLGGSAREIDLEARGLLRLRAQMNELLAHHTGQPIERIERDTDRGLTLTAEEARAYGLIDGIAGAGESSASRS
ncbi:MAG TPA: ATP-dependent Clp protease proteolytic subunit [bacterium]|nr:ATP-dependent Clp protease proteolytic subunit [bacterium]